MNIFKKILSDKKGATAIEYGMIIALVSIVIAAYISNITIAIDHTLENVNEQIE